MDAPSPMSLEIYCHTLQWYCLEAIEASGDEAIKELFSHHFTGKNKGQSPSMEQPIAFEPLEDARTKALQADLLRMIDDRWRISTLNATFSVRARRILEHPGLLCVGLSDIPTVGCCPEQGVGHTVYACCSLPHP